MSQKKYFSCEEFHNNVKQVYFGQYGWAINKKHADMANVIYHPTHENLNYEGEKRGQGKNFATWVFSEENGTKENIFSAHLDLVIDANLEPSASIGLHFHNDNEEIYYIIAGSIKMTTVSATGQEFTQELTVGDAHLVKRGQGHYGTAGPQGVRFITIAVR